MENLICYEASHSRWGHILSPAVDEKKTGSEWGKI